MRILVADDDNFFLQVIKDILTGAGHEVILAGSGPEAQERIMKEKPDLVILDVLMPGILGTELSEKLRHYSSSAGLPILLMSSFIPRGPGSEGGHEEFLADDFIQKPFEPEELLACIDRLARSGSKFSHLGNHHPPAPAPKKMIVFENVENNGDDDDR